MAANQVANRRIPPRVVDVIRAGADDTPAIELATRWRASGSALLVLAGIDHGQGKSVTLGKLCWPTEDEPLTPHAEIPLVIQAADLCRGICNKDLRQRMRRARMLSIDDVGLEPPQPRSAVALDEVVSRRFEQGLPTAIATPLSAEDFARRYARIADRAAEDGQVVELEGPSLRRAG